jgi:predicted Zn-dependent protease
MQEEIGTGGGGFRFMYAAFLQEAGQLLGSPQLHEASQMMTDAGDMWRRFALACAKACKSKTADFSMAEIARFVHACAEQEKRVFALLKTARLP